VGSSAGVEGEHLEGPVVAVAAVNGVPSVSA